ncbi:hypothetical protein [Nocardia sp. NPDC052566]
MPIIDQQYFADAEQAWARGVVLVGGDHDEALTFGALALRGAE